MTRQGRKKPVWWGDYEKDANTYENMFASLFQTAIRVKISKDIQDDSGEHTPVTSSFILGCLYRYGRIAYDKTTGLWLPYYGEGAPDAYGFCKTYRLYSPYNGNTSSRRREDLYLFTANANAMPLAEAMRPRAAIVADIENAIRQNLDTIKECTVITGVDEELSKTVEEADDARRKGASMVYLTNSALKYADIKNFKVGGTYLVSQLQEARRAELEEAYLMLGVRSPIDKASGVSQGEMDTQNARISAFLRVLLNTANEQAKAQDAPVEFLPAEKEEETQNANNEPTEGKESGDGGKTD